MGPLPWSLLDGFKGLSFKLGHAVAQLAEALVQAGRSRVRFPMVSLEFITDINLPAALWPWG
jgi:hypothetical protein